MIHFSLLCYSQRRRIMDAGFIPDNGGYRNLVSYRKTVIIYDATVYFCKRFFRHDRRQTDQMEQAARSGKQNIAEGSLASATSKQTEIHLTNVARASLGELQEDYEDFLRLRKLPAWHKDYNSALRLTELSRRVPDVYAEYAELIENESAEISANTIRHLILQACYMLNRQIKRLEQDFLQKGGIRERMTAARKAFILSSSSIPSSDIPSSPSSLSSPSSHPPYPPLPLCPLCNSPMMLRTARKGINTGKSFYGCSIYPDCRGTMEI